jgi:hypothetical protein
MDHQLGMPNVSRLRGLDWRGCPHRYPVTLRPATVAARRLRQSRKRSPMHSSDLGLHRSERLTGIEPAISAWELACHAWAVPRSCRHANHGSLGGPGQYAGRRQSQNHHSRNESQGHHYTEDHTEDQEQHAKNAEYGPPSGPYRPRESHDADNREQRADAEPPADSPGAGAPGSDGPTGRGR